MKQEGLNVQFSTPVTKVTELGRVILQNGTQLNFDAVVVTVRPPSVTALVPQQLRSVFANSTTGLRDVWIFNTTLLPSLDATSRQTLSGMFQLTVTVNGSLGPTTGYPTYVVRLYEDTPYIAVGGYVSPDVSQDSSTATATEAMQQFGLKAESVVAYRRIAYPSKVKAFPDQVIAGKVHLLGEALSGIGLALATEYVPNQIQAWFGNAIV